MYPRSVFCIASSRGRADRILHGLLEAGISDLEISVLLLEQTESRDHPPVDQVPDPSSTRRDPAGVIRGVLGTLDGVGPLTLPHAGRFIAAGALMAALTGSRGSTRPAGIAGSLIGFGLPSPEAARYETRIKEGEILISVRTVNPEKCDRARDIFAAQGAQDVFTMVTVTTPKPSFRGAHSGSRIAAA